MIRGKFRPAIIYAVTQRDDRAGGLMPLGHDVAHAFLGTVGLLLATALSLVLLPVLYHVCCARLRWIR